MTQPQPKRKVRRGRGYSKKCSEKSVKIIGNNSAGLLGKKDSFINLMNKFKPGVSMVQETKIYRKGQIKVDNYCVFDNLRGQAEGGGLMTLVHFISCEIYKCIWCPGKCNKLRKNGILCAT